MESEGILCNQIIGGLFGYLSEKDVFEAFFKKALARRLLAGKSSSNDLEKAVLARLKAECGATFTAKLEGMFTDMDLAAATMADYTAYLSSNITAVIEEEGGNAAYGPLIVLSSSSSAAVSAEMMSVTLLTVGHWPAPPSHMDSLISTLTLPSELARCMKSFESFYNSRFQGRRLTWAWALHRCVLTGHFKKGKRDLDCSLPQALVLRAFNVSSSMTMSQLRQVTNLQANEGIDELKLALAAMVAAKVLVKDTNGEESYGINDNFNPRLYRVKLPTASARETSTSSNTGNNEEETRQTMEEVFRDRAYAVDAAIVRVMKARRRMGHAALIGEVLTQLRFPAANADVKKRVEALIEREYLERDPEDTTAYRYLA